MIRIHFDTLPTTFMNLNLNLNHPLIVINLARRDVITISRLYCIKQLNLLLCLWSPTFLKSVKI